MVIGNGKQKFVVGGENCGANASGAEQTSCNSDRQSLLVFILQVNRNVHCFMTDSS